MQAMIMIVPPTSETMESILATRPRRTAPSRFPCSRLFLDWGRRSKRLLASAWLKRINSKNQTHTHTQILLSPWWSRQIQQCWWARLGRSRPARRGGGSLWLWSGPMVGWWRCWSGEKATAWARRRCSRWSSPCSPSWSCRDEGKRWSAAFWEERRRLERCSSPRTLSGSRYLRVKDEEDKEVKRQCSPGSSSTRRNLTFPPASWLSSCPTLPPSPPAASLWGQTQVTHRSSASRWWLWRALLWICCGRAWCQPGCCCSCGWALRLWLAGTAQRRGPGSTGSRLGPEAMVVLPQAKGRGRASCSQPCWQKEKPVFVVQSCTSVVTPGARKWF